ncbi:tkl family protein kinase [Plakobranchus ocellatus]|uniref:Tkl family protein kinase n=1 Tax=Plakobranchus ocellatus TaxID=259542 RepID=A0AAV3ZB68_9GAST|nr:tkl family protein kinase [Plakobranchus ocellatus]
MAVRQVIYALLRPQVIPFRSALCGKKTTATSRHELLRMSNTQGESCCDCTDGSYSDSRATVAVAEEVQNSFLNEVHLNKVANLRGPNTLLCQSDQHPYRPIVLKFFPRNSMRFLRETSAIGRLRHSNVIEWLRAIPRPDFNVVVYNFCPYGNLASHVGQLNFGTICRYVFQISHALFDIHSLKIVHGDIKLDNILVDAELNPRICGFDLSECLPPVQNHIEGRRGTAGFIAPEMDLDPRGRFDGFKTDAYSLGAVLVCLLFGINLTGRQRDLASLINQAIWPTRPVDLLLRLIATNLLTPDPQLRWDTRQLMQVFTDNRDLLAEFCGDLQPWLYTNPSMVPNLHLINNLTEEEHEFSYQEQCNIL